MTRDQVVKTWIFLPPITSRLRVGKKNSSNFSTYQKTIARCQFKTKPPQIYVYVGQCQFKTKPFQTYVGQVRTLSGGQQRRLSLAMALLHQPPILILDEPTVSINTMDME